MQAVENCRKGPFVRRAKDGLEEAYMLITSELSARVMRHTGEVEDLGVISRKVVTTAFVNKLVDELQSSASDFSTYKNHKAGTGTGAESSSDTDLGSEAAGTSGGSGTQTEGASANVYKSVATLTFSDSFSITEHGLFSDADVLMDRSVFSAISVEASDSIEFTYQLTVNAGG